MLRTRRLAFCTLLASATISVALACSDSGDSGQSGDGALDGGADAATDGGGSGGPDAG
ncbi:MAG: hypothetical protein FJ104_13545, partial [Deltaproteobacteria bacterium]|nr:hypothetical protein [Deltaproteobacteria bacterium]